MFMAPQANIFFFLQFSIETLGTPTRSLRARAEVGPTRNTYRRWYVTRQCVNWLPQVYT